MPVQTRAIIEQCTKIGKNIHKMLTRKDSWLVQNTFPCFLFPGQRCNRAEYLISWTTDVLSRVLNRTFNLGQQGIALFAKRLKNTMKKLIVNWQIFIKYYCILFSSSHDNLANFVIFFNQLLINFYTFVHHSVQI